MSDIKFEDRKIRDRNIITLPIELMEFLNISVGDIIGFDLINERIFIHKVIPHRMKNDTVGDK